MAYINRSITASLKRVSTKFPVVMVTGPRQSGKSTLLKHCFPKKEYVSLENPDVRRQIKKDANGFLNNFPKGAVLDEVQRVPDIFSYIQTNVDADNKVGKFILSGSQNFLLMKNVTQSLAGRVAILRLLPLSMDEYNVDKMTLNKVMFNGFYPRMIDKKISAHDFFPAYLESYLHRDVRELQNIGDLTKFTHFLQLCAGRIGQLLNLNNLANDCAVSQPTIKAWMSVLEASHVVYLLKPYHENFNKRIVKMPKLYFCDTGLACSLLGLHSDKDLKSHFMKGALLENLVLMELFKAFYSKNIPPHIYFWRDKLGNEIDFLIQKGLQTQLVEVKSSETFSTEHFKGINYFNKISAKKNPHKYVIYGGEKEYKDKFGTYIPWRKCADVLK